MQLQNGALLEDVRVRAALAMVSAVCAHPLPLDEVIEAAGIKELFSKNAGKLSGGEAQRVRFALALLPDPEVILLDEPTVAMDVDTRRRFWERIRALAAAGRTIVFTTHHLEEAEQNADRVVLLHHGRIVADGTGDEITGRIGGRSVTCALGAGRSAFPPDLASLPGVTDTGVDTEGRLRLASDDSDRTLAALFAPDGPAARGDVRDVGVSRPSLEEAFVYLTQS